MPNPAIDEMRRAGYAAIAELSDLAGALDDGVSQDERENLLSRSGALKARLEGLVRQMRQLQTEIENHEQGK